MSYHPLFHESNYITRPTTLLDQHFADPLVPEDLSEPFTVPRNSLSYTEGYFKLKGSGKNQFNVYLDVQQFKPQEISIEVTGENTITIEGKHEEKEDEHGYISRQFVRRYVVPKNYDIWKVESKLSSDGVLTISAPSKEIKRREIPILQTGEPAERFNCFFNII